MLTLVPTPLGNLGDITYRAVETLREAQYVLCEDTRVTRKLLRLLSERLGIDFPDIPIESFHEHNGPRRLPEVAEALRGERVVYLSDAGMPAISDPGKLLVNFCQEEGIDYDVLPGPSAVVTAYAASGFSGRFAFWGFLPHKGPERVRSLREALAQPPDAIFYEAPHRLFKLLEALRREAPDRRVFVAKELSKKHQRYFLGPIAEVYEAIEALGEARGEWVVVVEGRHQTEAVLRLEDVLDLDLPPKLKAKLLARLSDRSVKEWYALLTGGK
ncbi:16S rRNA (cytidine(1402)-2'-O)-methyltransferase [Nitratifractor sp.]